MATSKSIVSAVFASLLVSTAAPALVTLQCDSTTGPAGGSAVVNVRFTTDAGENVGGTQNRMIFDSSVLDASSPLDASPNCTINPDIGPGSVPDKRLARTFVNGDPGAIETLVVALDNQIPIPAGDLFSCEFAVAENAPREDVAITLDGVLISDPDGDLLPSDSISCQVTITDPPTPTRTPTPDGFCTGDGDCPPGEVCVGNRCATPTPPGFCEDNDDCDSDEVCIGNRCMQLTPTETNCPGFGNCSEDEVCTAEGCATPTPPGFCNDEDDCPGGEVCVDNRCATPTPPGFCEVNDDCNDGEVCVNNRCATPTASAGGGGGGCGCSVEPDPPLQIALNLLLASLPAVWLWRGRRRAHAAADQSST